MFKYLGLIIKNNLLRNNYIIHLHSRSLKIFSIFLKFCFIFLLKNDLLRLLFLYRAFICSQFSNDNATEMKLIQPNHLRVSVHLNFIYPCSISKIKISFPFNKLSIKRLLLFMQSAAIITHLFFSFIDVQLSFHTVSLPYFQIYFVLKLFLPLVKSCYFRLPFCFNVSYNYQNFYFLLHPIVTTYLLFEWSVLSPFH